MSLGQAVVEISGDTSKLSKDASDAGKVIEKSFGGAARKAISNLSSTISGVSGNIRGLGDSSGVIGRTFSRLGGQLSSVFSGIGSAASSAFSSMVSAAEGAAAVVTGVLGTALVGGMGRLTSIDSAEAKLRGLGHSAESVETIMNSALESVKGTAFGLGDAATLSATAVAAGIEPGKALTRELKLMADAAAITGGDLTEIGSILNKTTTSQKVYTQELNQLADRGLPVFTWLQEAYGVSADELRDMVSQGKVDAETFREVLEENIGGAALASGESFVGAFANVKAALGRLGATLLEPLFNALKDVGFPALMGLFDGIGEAIGPMIENLTESPGFQKVIDFFESLPEKIGPAIEKIGELGPVAGAAGAAFAALGSSGISSLLGPFGAIIPTINPVLAAFAGLIAASPELREAFGKMFETLQPALESVMEVVGTVAGELAEALVPVVEMLAESLGEIIPIILEVVEAFLPLLPILIDALTPVIPVLAKGIEGIARVMRVLAPIIAKVVEVFAPFAPLLLLFMGPLPALIALIAGITYVFDNFGAILEWIGDVISTVAGIVVDVFMGLWNALYGEVSQALSSIVGFFQALPGRIVGALSSLASAVTGIFRTAMNAVATVITTLINGWITLYIRIPIRIAQALGSLAQTLLGIFQRAMSAVLNFVVGSIGNAVRFYAELPGKAASALSNLGASILGVFQNAFNSLRTFVSNAINGIVNVIGGMPGRIVSSLSSLGSRVRSAVSGAWDGLTDAFKGAINAIIRTWNNFRFPKASFGGGGIGPFRVPKIEVGGWALPRINYLADGGILRSPTLAMMAEAGSNEAVIPLNSRGAQFMQEIVPEGSGGLDDESIRSLAEAVSAAMEARPTVVELSAGGGDQLMDEIIRGLRQRVARQGGDVQVVLGGVGR